MEVLRTSTGAHGEDAISKIISNLSKLPLQAIKAAQSTPSSKAETPQQKDVFILKSRSYYGKLFTCVLDDWKVLGR